MADDNTKEEVSQLEDARISHGRPDTKVNK